MKNENQYISVGTLTDQIKITIERLFEAVYVRGEISGFKPSSTGHWYFTLKDSEATISAIIFKGQQRQIMESFQECGISQIKDGQEVFIQGKLSLYKKGGNYSIIIQRMTPVGTGSLFLKFEILKKRLEQEGLFDPERKKKIPEHPVHIGIVTSPTGAALQDMLNILKRRSPGIKVTVFPAAVQGDEAKFEIQKAIQYADYHYRTHGKHRVDVLIVARGGGAIEDLWAFNEPEVAYSIAACCVPVISGVGHEIDFTIADFCADLRAPTPSSAAELVAKSSEEWMNQVAALRIRLQGAFHLQLKECRSRYEACSRERLKHFIAHTYTNYLQSHLYAAEKLNHLFQNCFLEKKHRYVLLTQRLNSLNPLCVLERGYAVVYNREGRVVSCKSMVERGEALRIIVKDGEITALENSGNDCLR